MKRMLVLTMLMTMAFIGAAYAGQTNTNPNTNTDAAEGLMTEAPPAGDMKNNLPGGWFEVMEDGVPQEAAAALEKALEGLTGAVYEPVRLLAKQVVSGTNYALLCRVTVVYPDAEPEYCIVYVSEDLEGNAELVRVQEFVSAEYDYLVDGWSAIASTEDTEAANAALEKALEEMEGAEYESIAALAQQVVAGTNYELLCKITPVVPDAEGTYSLVTVYEDLEGNAEILEVMMLQYSLTDEEEEDYWIETETDND